MTNRFFIRGLEAMHVGAGVGWVRPAFAGLRRDKAARHLPAGFGPPRYRGGYGLAAGERMACLP
jgi:hypothetical protein